MASWEQSDASRSQHEKNHAPCCRVQARDILKVCVCDERGILLWLLPFGFSIVRRASFRGHQRSLSTRLESVA